MTKDVKFLEIRDKDTFIPVMAIEVSRNDGYLARRAGFGSPCVFLVTLVTEKCRYDPYEWSDRTMCMAHQHIDRNFDRLHDGDVIDVEYLLGETGAPRPSARAADHDETD